MADETKLHKMNVRSPFYVIVKDEGKPTSIGEADPDDQTDDDQPDTPDEYVEPDAQTEIVQCGDVINIGTDVGTRTFKLDTQDTTGDFTLDYRVNRPIRITATSGSTTNQFNSNRFIGDIGGILQTNQLALVAAGVNVSELDLSSGEATGTYTFTKTDNGDDYISYKVEAPLVTDDYTLTFNCPTVSLDTTLSNPGDRSITQTVFGLLTTKTSRTNNPTLLVNGTIVANRMTPGATYIFDDNDLGQPLHPNTLSPTTAVYISRSTHFKQGINKIELRYQKGHQGQMWMSRYGIYHTGTQFKHTYPGSELDFSAHKTHPYNSGSHAFASGSVINVSYNKTGIYPTERSYSSIVWYIYDDGSGNSYLTLPNGVRKPGIGDIVKYFNQPYELAQAQERFEQSTRGGSPILDGCQSIPFIPARTKGGDSQFNWYSPTD